MMTRYARWRQVHALDADDAYDWAASTVSVLTEVPR
jgi:hypothetical protein